MPHSQALLCDHLLNGLPNLRRRSLREHRADNRQHRREVLFRRIRNIELEALSFLVVQVALLALGHIVGAEAATLLHVLSALQEIAVRDADVAGARVVPAERRLATGRDHTLSRVALIQVVEHDMLVAAQDREIVLEVPGVGGPTLAAGLGATLGYGPAERVVAVHASAFQPHSRLAHGVLDLGFLVLPHLQPTHAPGSVAEAVAAGAGAEVVVVVMVVVVQSP